MNQHNSHAQRVLASNYRRVYSRMRWLNAMAERGLRPVLQAAAKLRRFARGEQRARRKEGVGLAGFLPQLGLLEPRLMLAAHDGSVAGQPDTYTFVTLQGADVVVVEELSAGVGKISGTSGGVAFQETFTNYKRVVIVTCPHE